MAQLWIEFVGICTHFNRNALQGTPLQGRLPVPHRVVFPQTAAVPITVLQPSGQPQTFTFALQQPTLQLPDSTNIPLTGQRMFIDTDVSLPPPDFTSTCIPNLTTIWPEMLPNLPAVLESAPPAIAYFDILTGVISSFNHTSSAASRLVLDVPGPGPAMLVIENFDGSPSRVIPIDLNATAPSTITIENHPFPSIDVNDNLGQGAELQLNFLVAQPQQFPPPVLPDIDQAIQAIITCIQARLLTADAGPGCSNSQYP